MRRLRTVLLQAAGLPVEQHAGAPHVIFKAQPCTHVPFESLMQIARDGTMPPSASSSSLSAVAAPAQLSPPPAPSVFCSRALARAQAALPEPFLFSLLWDDDDEDG